MSEQMKTGGILDNHPKQIVCETPKDERGFDPFHPSGDHPQGGEPSTFAAEDCGLGPCDVIDRPVRDGVVLDRSPFVVDREFAKTLLDSRDTHSGPDLTPFIGPQDLPKPRSASPDISLLASVMNGRRTKENVLAIERFLRVAGQIYDRMRPDGTYRLAPVDEFDSRLLTAVKQLTGQYSFHRFPLGETFPRQPFMSDDAHRRVVALGLNEMVAEPLVVLALLRAELPKAGNEILGLAVKESLGDFGWLAPRAYMCATSDLVMVAAHWTLAGPSSTLDLWMELLGHTARGALVPGLVAGFKEPTVGILFA